jgi:hypothetical protein
LTGFTKSDKIEAMRHVLKISQKSDFVFCSCRKWRMKYNTVLPWQELVEQADRLVEEFEKHQEEAEKKP